MTGAGGVLAFVLLGWSAGTMAGAAWTQSWKVVTRGHFRVVAWTSLVLAGMALPSVWAATETLDGASVARALAAMFVVSAILYLVAEYSQDDATASLAGYVTAGIGALALVASGALLDGWPPLLAAAGLISGAGLWGATTNGMLLGHWYLNQPGLKEWALARLTTLGMITTGATALLGLVAAGRLIDAPTEGAALGLPGFGADLGPAFFWIWLALVGFTAAVIYMARRCIQIRSIQSATGLYYVAILTAGVSEFLVRYLMVNASA